jgi:Tfp pilus assembly protein PilE
MRIALLILTVLITASCATPAWQRQATRLKLSEAEISALVQTAEAKYRTPCSYLEKDADGRIKMWLSRDGHAGQIIYFQREGGRWIEKESMPWWE